MRTRFRVAARGRGDETFFFFFSSPVSPPSRTLPPGGRGVFEEAMEWGVLRLPGRLTCPGGPHHLYPWTSFRDAGLVERRKSLNLGCPPRTSTVVWSIEVFLVMLCHDH